MNLTIVPGLPTTPVPALGAPGIPTDWFRAVPTAYIATPMATAHLVGRRNRFNPGPTALPQFALLYLAEDPITALMEVGALFGNPVAPATWIRNPLASYAVFKIRVTVPAVVDLSAVPSQASLTTTAQELTGDWQGYETRRLPWSSIPLPVGPTPTQELGEALARRAVSGTLRTIQGFLAVSARVPLKRNLVLFDPAQLEDSGSIKLIEEVALATPAGSS